jgi:hypothetical protein
LLGLQEPITPELPELTWQDSVWLVVLFISTAAILHVAFFYLIARSLGLLLFGAWPPQIPPPGWVELAIVAVINGLILAVRARHRLWDWTYCAPALLLALWSVGLFISDVAGEYKRAEGFRQSIADYKDIEERMLDPNFLMTLKPPISSTCKSAVFAALNTGQRTPGGVPLTSAEVHAVLTNLGSDPEIEEGVALSPMTSVEDLQWLAVHGNQDTRAYVGQNPHTPPETRRQLMNDLDVVSYRIGITAAARLCDPELNRIFWNRENRRDLPKIDLAYQELAVNPCTPKDILRKLETFPEPVGPKARATVLGLSTKSKEAARQ